jgi:hypothetical protein
MPDIGPNRMRHLRSGWVLRVGSARARTVARIARGPLIMGSLDEAVDWTLFRVHVIQPVVGADRVGVRRSPGANPRTGKLLARYARTTGHLTSRSDTRPCNHERDCAHGYCDQSFDPHFSLSLSEQPRVVRTEDYYAE